MGDGAAVDAADELRPAKSASPVAADALCFIVADADGDADADDCEATGAGPDGWCLASSRVCAFAFAWP